MSWLGRLLASAFTTKPRDGIDGINDQRAKHGLPPISKDSAILAPVGPEPLTIPPGATAYAAPDPAAHAVSVDYARRMAVILQADPEVYQQVGNGLLPLDAAEMLIWNRSRKPQEPENPAQPPQEPKPGHDCKTTGPEGCSREGCKRKKAEPAPAPQNFTFTFDPYREGQ